ncbi:MAG TPA: glycosyltransferase family 39 protein [Bryobacteraceae bacterium]|nr:glycosyltransferase family 39 protein [Bryobacteraceae bacterium]
MNRNFLLACLLSLCLIRLWLMPLASSFWVDETATAFVVTHGAGDPSLRVAPQVPASIYYVLPRLSTRWFGPSEIAYRFPSLLALGAALFCIARLAARLIRAEAAWFAVFACLALKGFNYQAADARPYALGTCVACAGVWLLVDWLDRGGWARGLAFVAAASLLWRVHLLDWPFYLVFAVYAALRLSRPGSAEGARVSWSAAGAAAGLLAVCLLPVAAEALALREGARAHVMSALPGITDLFHSLKLGLVLAPAALAAIVARCLGRSGDGKVISFPALGLILAWWLTVPLGLLAFSRITGTSVFLERYLSLSLPGAAFVSTAAAAHFLPPRWWKAAAALMGCAALLAAGNWREGLPRHHDSDWRGAAAALNREQEGGAMPVLCPSPFLEAAPPVWRPDYPVQSFLYSHLVYYPIAGRVYPFPFADSPQAEAFAAALSAGTLSASPRFAIYGQTRIAGFWRNWFRARPELAGWRVRNLGDFGDVEAVVFEKPR